LLTRLTIGAQRRSVAMPHGADKRDSVTAPQRADN
jgi:hypothetical protein